MNITGIHLNSNGNKVEVNIEVDGKWYQVIEENREGPFSWITEEAGMKKKILENRRPSYESG